jgi:hypothetical protein
MADDAPDKIIFGIGQGSTRKMIRLADGSYADVIAPAFGSGQVTDTTGEHTFDISSLPSKYTYDGDRNMTTATYGPNPSGKFVRQSSTYTDGLLVAETGWFLVASLEAP